MRGAEKLPWSRSSIALLAHPGIWITALRLARRAAPVGWWHRFPFLPRLDSRYIEFRLETQYGDAGIPEPKDLVVYLKWCRNMERIRRA